MRRMQLLAVVAVMAMPTAGQTGVQSSIERNHAGYLLSAGPLTRQLTLSGTSIATSSLKVAGASVIDEPQSEFRFTVRLASPDRKPHGLKPGEGSSVDTSQNVATLTNELNMHEQANPVKDDVAWTAPITVNGESEVNRSDVALWSKNVIHHLSISGKFRADSLAYSIHYEVYDGYPAIRKWMTITNVGKHWLKIDGLRIEDWSLAQPYRNLTPLTPSERGAMSSLVAAGLPDGTRGIILGNEIPSALRDIEPSGAMGYADRYFEWVLGPGEQFVTEPVFTYAYDGEATRTISAISTPLDRTVESEFQRFLRTRIGLLADGSKLPAPYFSTWTNFGPHIDDQIVRHLAELASRAGFAILQLDDGWQRDRLGTEIDTTKFPDFDATSRFVRATGLRLGLWVSTFRSADSAHQQDIPDGASRPAIRHLSGYGMSFASPWREYYARSLSDLARKYGVTYYKEDFSNIRFGDIAEGHESRTLKESLLRGLRGILQAQDSIRAQVPGIALEITHEAYWGTPGVPCDLAVLKHANLYHIPPNDYSGVGNRSAAYQESLASSTDEMRQGLLEGALHARQRFFLHRGLPLDSIEFYAAATVNIHGSMTAAVQDRQVASWLMGAPLVFSGDLSSLTAENLDHYQKLFNILKRLQSEYGIYDYFEFSGVPASPTDQDWEWWGKLNPTGYGAVVVLRGDSGAASRDINVPWVQENQSYKVRTLLQEKELGVFTGRELMDGKLHLELPPYGQEIVELYPAK